jgi:NAD(P)-dependent dehydrogenase (short-subunit alcohol dehydrogenase family)
LEVKLSRKILLITGSTQGVGLAIAEEAANSGAEGILITGRNVERGALAVDRLADLGCKAHFVAADMADPVAPAIVTRTCLDAFGRVDCLVNSAGITDRAGLNDATPDAWDRIMAINARAPFFMMQHAATAMRARGQGGSVVNILSMNVHCGIPELAVYSAAKGGMATATRNAANTLLKDRIRVNGINMGWAATPAEMNMQANIMGQGEGWVEAANAAQPFGRLLTAQDVARLAIFLLSDFAIPMTGALIDQEQWVVGAHRSGAHDNA